MRPFWIWAACIALGASVGLGAVTLMDRGMDRGDEQGQQPHSEQRVEQRLKSGAMVQVITVKVNGRDVQCVAVDGYNRAAIDCDYEWAIREG